MSYFGGKSQLELQTNEAMSMIQLKICIRATVIVKPPVKKQELAEPGTFDPFEKLLGNDLVGINIRPVHDRDFSRVSCKWVHEFRVGRVGGDDSKQTFNTVR